MHNTIQQSFFFDKRTSTAFFLEGKSINDVKLMSAPMSSDGNILMTHQEIVDKDGGGLNQMVWTLLMECNGGDSQCQH